MICCSCQVLQGWVPVAPRSAPRSAASANRRARASRCLSSASAKFSPRPERISISERISSPATASASTGSAIAAERSSSKRWSSERVTGSRMANSSSIPTVKSVEASNTSLTRGMSSMAGVSGQVEVERVEQVDGRARGVHCHLGRHLEQGLGVVEDDLDAGVDEVVGHLLGGPRRHGEHAHDHVLVADHALELVVWTHRQVVVHAHPDLGRVLVEESDDPEAVVGEDVRAGDRLPEVARSEQRDVVLAGGPQDLADLRHERVDVVAHAALAELAEPGQVAADLRGVDVRVVGELLGRDRLATHLLGLGEDLQIARQAGSDPERESLRSAVVEPGATRDGLLEAHAPTLPSRTSSASSSTKYSKRSSPSSATTGMRSP